MKESKFQSKLSFFLISIIFLKLVYIIGASIAEGSIWYFVKTLLLMLLVFFIAYFLVDSFFNPGSSGGSGMGGSSLLGDQQFDTLMRRYEKLCDEFIEKKQFKKAAYIQLKLLRNPHRGAYILKEGGLYNEAAIVFLRKCKDKYEAAECYEKARSYTKAIKIYKELDQNETIGDIYTKLKDTKNAHAHYQMVIDDYAENEQYVKASLIYRKKMNDASAASHLLLKGWREQKDAINCLNNHFMQFEHKEALQNEIDNFYKYEVNHNNQVDFLAVLKHEYNKKIAKKEDIQKIAYELISKNSHKQDVLSHLNYFVKEDRHISKDIIKHRLKK